MGYVIPPEGRKVSSLELNKLWNVPPEEETTDLANPFVRSAEKTSLIGKQISSPRKEGALSGRKIAPLAQSDELTNRIVQLTKDWDEMTPDELAESIIDLEDRVQVLKSGESPGIEKIEQLVKHLHFRYVFPLVQELSLEGKEGNLESIQIPFAQQIYRVADEIIQQNSLLPFAELSDLQKREVYRYALILGSSE